MQKWEYKVITLETKGTFRPDLKVGEFEEQINKLGDEGWELTNSQKFDGSGGWTFSLVYVFRREK